MTDGQSVAVPAGSVSVFGAAERNRTLNRQFTKLLHCLLCYSGEFGPRGPTRTDDLPPMKRQLLPLSYSGLERHAGIEPA